MSIAAIVVVFSLPLFIRLVRLRIYRPTTLRPKNLGDASRDNQSLTFLFRHLTTIPVVLSTCSVNSLLSTLLMIFLHVLSTVPLFRSSKDRGAGLKENPDSGQTHMAGEVALLETSA